MQKKRGNVYALAGILILMLLMPVYVSTLENNHPRTMLMVGLR